MRIVSMVPSWTETLIACGANVVGRTRFCIHPKESVKPIAVVGGTKNIDWEKLKNLNPDLLLLDKEENPRSMSDESPVPVLATHVTGISVVADEIEKIAQTISDDTVGRALRGVADSWRNVQSKRNVLKTWSDFPGVFEWTQEPDLPPSEAKFVYVIWKDPWMAVAPGTFIASVLETCGIPSEALWPGPESQAQTKYPVFDPKDLPEETVYLFSTEPYPFHKKKAGLENFGRGALILDGECFSWFGVRSLQFLKKVLF